jgi:hypothetical protein
MTNPKLLPREDYNFCGGWIWDLGFFPDSPIRPDFI